MLNINENENEHLSNIFDFEGESKISSFPFEDIENFQFSKNDK